MIAGDTTMARRVVDNKRRAVLAVLATGACGGLIVGLLSLLVLPGLGAVVVFVVATAVLAAIAWWGSEPLARRLIGAQPADPIRHARLFNLVEALCVNAGVPPPGLYVVADDGLNALTVGRTPAAPRWSSPTVCSTGSTASSSRRCSPTNWPTSRVTTFSYRR